MHCETHEAIAIGICPFCGRGICPRCPAVQEGSRRACCEDCLAGLKVLDDSAILAVTKGKRSLKANVLFCLLVGIAIVALGLLSLVGGLSNWPFALSFSLLGFAMMGGAAIYARALRDK